MASNRCVIVLFCLFCSLYCGWCELHLSEGARCIVDKIYQGTCVRLFKCGSAVLTYLYRNAGFENDTYLPPLPELCSHRSEEPVVCCTDCVLSTNDEFKESAVAPSGILVSRTGSKAWKKCLDYFHKLPYPCRGKGLVSIEKQWVEATRCHNSVLRVNVSVAEPKPLQWNFPHQARLGYGDDLSSVQWLCEGTVISERFILTSAHCTNAGVFGTMAFASLGLQNNKEPPEYWNTHKIKKVIIHPSYNEPSWYHDIALLETETEIMFDSQILPACLDVDVHDKSEAETAGKRTQVIDNNISEITEMQPILFNELDTIDCILAYKRANNLMHGFDSKLQMCYGRQNVSEETCKVN
ncbi:serine protease snake-like [Spodoptera frugiperda]|uniref:Serine protease snake-like n=1 Tax=Spodoptera frugiperda TaxID=7108 RepID=A0A9R0EZV9_SPOFR|nr:serine protease snake-like [Spodoptera frugiperda]